MSFILESIKQAERERKLGQVPSISVEYTTPQTDFIEDKDWLKWFGVGVGIFLGVLITWYGTRMIVSNNFLEATNITNTANIEQHAENIVLQEEIVSVVSDEYGEEIETNSTALAESRKSVKDTTIQNIRNSQLKSIQLIKPQQQEIPVQIIDKRTKAIPEKTKIAEVNSQTLVASNSESNLISNQPESRRSKLYSMYSTLSTAAKDLELDKQETTKNVHFDKEINPQSEPMEGPHEFANKSNLRPEYLTINAVNTGVSEFGELPYDIQEKVPDLNISVHLFNQQPALRKVRINGRMYTEGANLQNDLALVEITRYGVIFDYRGHLFRLNVR